MSDGAPFRGCGRVFPPRRGIGSGCEGTPSSLYTLDPTDGSATEIGPITVDAQQIVHVTGLAVQPGTGTLYAIANGQDADCTDWGQATLLTIDAGTGAATVVGSWGSLVDGQYPDMSFDPFGTLYAWNEWDDDLEEIDITDGTSSPVGSCSCSTWATGLAVDSGGRMFMKDGADLHRVSHGSGESAYVASLDETTHNMAAFDPNDVLFTGRRTSSTSFTLMTVDVGTGTTTDIGSSDVGRVSAIAFDPGTVTPPAVIDLSLTKDVTPTAPDPGQNVVFTLEVSNAGPSAATGVTVSDVLPAGYLYVSDDGGGDFDDGTGVWTVGSVAASGSETLQITATVQLASAGDYLNTAHVATADEYDIDSVPEVTGGTEDDEASAAITVTFDITPPSISGLSVHVRGPRVTTTFGLNEAATTTCQVSGGATVPCASGDTIEVPAGNHSMTVRATDTTGNTSSSTTFFQVRSRKIKT